MLNINYVSKAKALYQVKLILELLPYEEYKLIPQEIIDYIEYNYEYDKKLTINPNISLNKQNVDDRTYTILKEILGYKLYLIDLIGNKYLNEITVNKLDNNIKKLIKYLKIENKVIGIIIYGSTIIGYSDELSDTDILIVVKNKDNHEQSRGSHYIDGIKYEYFIETEANVYKGMYEEIDFFDDINRNKFILGRIVYDIDQRLMKIKEKAVEMSEIKYRTLSRKEKEFKAIYLYNKLNIVKRKFIKKEEDYNYYYYYYLENFMHFYYDINLKTFSMEKGYKGLIDDRYRNAYRLYDIEDEYVKNIYVELIKKPEYNKLEKLVNYILMDILPNKDEYRIYYK